MKKSQEQQIFGTVEAQKYLGVDRHMMRYYVHVAKQLKPDGKIGNSNIFKKETLDEFKRQYLSNQMTIEEAAQYLGLKVSTLRWHMRETKLLQPDAKRGNNYIFTKETLDAIRPHITPQKQP